MSACVCVSVCVREREAESNYLTTTQGHHDDISQNRQDISSNLSKINDISNNGIKDIEDSITDLSDNRIKILRII